MNSRNFVKGFHRCHTSWMTSPAPLDAARPTRRERLRESTLREIVEAARGQLRTVGPQGLTLASVARQLGMTAPALYRYVDGVDGLITLLVSEGFLQLARRLRGIRDAVPREDPGGRFDAVAQGVRQWALEDPALYGLLFGSPLPGYAAPQDGPTTASAREASAVMWTVLLDAQDGGRLGPPLVTTVEPDLLPLLADKGGEALSALSREHQVAGWTALSLLLGAVSIEVFGHMPPCDDVTCSAAFRAKVAVARRVVGLPDPDPDQAGASESRA